MNPFKDKMMRKAFDECVAAFGRNSSALQHHSGNSIAQNFYRGYDNIPMNWDSSSKKSMAYAQYRAGVFCKKKVSA